MPLGELLDIQNGFAFSSDCFNEEPRGLPLIRIRDLAKGTTTTFFNGPYDERYRVRKGDFLIGMDGEFRCYRWQGQEALLNQRVCRLQNFREGVLPAFIYYGINDHLSVIESKTDFVTVKHISSRQIASIQMRIPPFHEQERIVAILDAAEALRRLRGQADNRAADLIPALFHEMFGDPATNTKRWQVVKVEAIAERVTKGTTPTTLGRTFSETGVPFLRAENLQNGTIDLSQGSLFIDEETDDLLSRSRIRENDVLISIAGTIGRMAVTPPSTGHMNCNQAVAVVRPLGKVIPVFLMHCLASAAIQRMMTGATVTGTISNLSLGQIKQVQIPLPPLPLQRHFATSVAGIRAMEANQATSRRRLDDLFQSLLHRAFRGDL